MPRFWLAVSDSSNTGLHKLSMRSLFGAIDSHLGRLADWSMIAKQRLETNHSETVVLCQTM